MGDGISRGLEVSVSLNWLPDYTQCNDQWRLFARIGAKNSCHCRTPLLLCSVSQFHQTASNAALPWHADYVAAWHIPSVTITDSVSYLILFWMVAFDNLY